MNNSADCKKTHKLRLQLGILNVGFWVLVTSSVLIWKTPLEILFNDLNPIFLLIIWIATYVALQTPFDLISNVLLKNSDSPEILRKQWIKGVAAQCLVFTLVSILLIPATNLQSGFCIGSMLVLLVLATSRVSFLEWITSNKTQELADSTVPTKIIDPQTSSFTGGLGWSLFSQFQILPEKWKNDSLVHIEKLRRNAHLKYGSSRRAIIGLIFWNSLGILLGAKISLYQSVNPAGSIIYFSSWMTIWSFISLLIFPFLSRGSLFAADRYAADIAPEETRKWLKKFPEKIDENGHVNRLLESIFYPIPSSSTRLEQLESHSSLPKLGNLARSNLFLSWATFNLTARAVHCNVGKPALWVFPPES